MHFSNEALSLKYFTKAKELTILYNTLFPRQESLKFRFHFSVQIQLSKLITLIKCRLLVWDRCSVNKEMFHFSKSS